MTFDERFEFLLAEIEYLKQRVAELEAREHRPLPIIVPFEDQLTTPTESVPKRVSDVKAGPVFTDGITEITRTAPLNRI